MPRSDQASLLPLPRGESRREQQRPLMVAGPVGGIDDRTGVHRLDGRDPRPDVRRRIGHASPSSDGWSFQNVFDIFVNIGVPVLGIVIASRRPENAIGWLLLAAGLALGLTGFSRAYALHVLVAEPGSLPGGRVAGWIANTLWPIPVGMLPFLFLLFPTGSLSRAVEAGAVVRDGSLDLLLVGTVVFATSMWNEPFTLADTARSGGSFALTLFVVVLYPPADRRWRVVRFGRGPISRGRSGTSASSSSGS